MTKQQIEKHPSCIAWEKWCASATGKAALEGTTSGEYLKNRLWRAFMDSWQAAQERLGGNR